jgi:acyl-coenzyme A thioesterase PaaI-like protein
VEKIGNNAPARDRVSAPAFLAKLKRTIELRLYTFWKIPLLFYLAPVVEELTEERCVVRLPLYRRTKNHLRSMYFGALASAADCACGLLATRLIRKKGTEVSLVFKNFQADFLRRAEGEVWFACEDGAVIRKMVEDTVSSGERVSFPVRVTATVPGISGPDPVALFELTLSLKKKSR